MAQTAPKADSAYQSMADTNEERDAIQDSNDKSHETRVTAFSILENEVYFFKKQLDAKVIQYYNSIRPLIEARLLAHLEADRRPFTMVPRLIGRTEGSATVHIVMFCAPNLEDIVNEIFTSAPVQDLLRLPCSNISLGFVAIPRSPTMTNALIDTRVLYQPSYTSTRNTYCGAPILLKPGNKDTREGFLGQATFGGIVKATYGDGKVRFYGMTANHPIESLQEQHDTIVTKETSKRRAKDNVFDLSHWVSDDAVIGQPLNLKELPGVSANRASPSYDWSLIQMKNSRQNLASQNFQPSENGSFQLGRSHSILIAQKPYFNDGVSDPVLLLGATSGAQFGELLSVPASIYLVQSERFVDAYMLEVKKGNGKIWHLSRPMFLLTC
jgi:hypothetical protein